MVGELFIASLHVDVIRGAHTDKGSDHFRFLQYFFLPGPDLCYQSLKSKAMDKVIFLTTMLDCSPERAFEMFTVNRRLESWLAVKAEVEPQIGGKYELFWDPGNPDDDSTIGCKILAMDRPHFICFEWKGTRQHKAFMNNVRPLTNVSVAFIPARGDQTKVVLIHTGWRDTEKWEQARQWFETAWTDTFRQLEKLVSEP